MVIHYVLAARVVDLNGSKLGMYRAWLYCDVHGISTTNQTFQGKNAQCSPCENQLPHDCGYTVTIWMFGADQASRFTTRLIFFSETYRIYIYIWINDITYIIIFYIYIFIYYFLYTIYTVYTFIIYIYIHIYIYTSWCPIYIYILINKYIYIYIY